MSSQALDSWRLVEAPSGRLRAERTVRVAGIALLGAAVFLVAIHWIQMPAERAAAGGLPLLPVLALLCAAAGLGMFSVRRVFEADGSAGTLRRSLLVPGLPPLPLGTSSSSEVGEISLELRWVRERDGGRHREWRVGLEGPGLAFAGHSEEEMRPLAEGLARLLDRPLRVVSEGIATTTPAAALGRPLADLPAADAPEAGDWRPRGSRVRIEHEPGVVRISVAPPGGGPSSPGSGVMLALVGLGMLWWGLDAAWNMLHEIQTAGAALDRVLLLLLTLGMALMGGGILYLLGSNLVRGEAGRTEVILVGPETLEWSTPGGGAAGSPDGNRLPLRAVEAVQPEAAEGGFHFVRVRTSEGSHMVGLGLGDSDARYLALLLREALSPPAEEPAES